MTQNRGQVFQGSALDVETATVEGALTAASVTTPLVSTDVLDAGTINGITSSAFGSHVVFPFAYNTASLNAGVTAYTATIGQYLLDAWIEVDTAWDGTTPLGDFGITTGLYAFSASQALDMTSPDTAAVGTGLLLGGIGGSIHNVDLLVGSGGGSFVRTIGKFTTAAVLKVWVSQDGLKGGTAPGAAQGAAKLHLIILV